MPNRGASHRAFVGCIEPRMNPSTPNPSTGELTERIAATISAAGGVIPFSRYMAMALYEPGLGYYERSPRTVGRDGDFATSVSVGTLFGELLAYWIREAVGALPGLASGPIDLVEAGAHDGRWAEDIMDALELAEGDASRRFRYRIVEPSALRRSWQLERLARFGDRVSWSDTMPDEIRGIILSNELLDAFPVERWRWNASGRCWVEQGVAWCGGRFEWAPMTTPSPPQWILTGALEEVLPDGFVRERSPAAVAWWGAASAALREGCLIAFDYGLETEEFLTPARASGTLRAYHRHRVSDDLLSLPGELDLTAHVDFSAVAEEGLRHGLSTWHRERQSRFLMRILEAIQRTPGRFPEWTPSRVRAFQTLTHPEHFGRGFRVLVQGRGPFSCGS